MTDPKERFSGRVKNYVRYRPGYPRAVLDLLRSECGLTSDSVVADVASGTGLLSELFLENGNQVYGVEPNAEMREAGEHRLERYDRFTSVAGSAEETMLEASSVDFVVVGQAFHWFDPDAARAEFVRVLRSGGWSALLWNEMREGATPFMKAYERLIREYKTEEYKPFDLPGAVRSFFDSGAFEAESFEHRQTFDLDGLKGRILSSSYVPQAGHPDYNTMMKDLEEIIGIYQEDGRVSIEYETLAYYGRLQPCNA